MLFFKSWWGPLTYTNSIEPEHSWYNPKSRLRPRNEFSILSEWEAPARAAVLWWWWLQSQLSHSAKSNHATRKKPRYQIIEKRERRKHRNIISQRQMIFWVRANVGEESALHNTHLNLSILRSLIDVDPVPPIFSHINRLSFFVSPVV